MFVLLRVFFFFLLSCCGTLPVFALSTPFECVSCIRLRPIFYLSVYVCHNTTAVFLKNSNTCATSIRPYVSSLPVRMMTHVSQQSCAVVAEDNNEIADSCTAISYEKKHTFGPSFTCLGFSMLGKSFTQILTTK